MDNRYFNPDDKSLDELYSPSFEEELFKEMYSSTSHLGKQISPAIYAIEPPSQTLTPHQELIGTKTFKRIIPDADGRVKILGANGEIAIKYSIFLSSWFIFEKTRTLIDYKQKYELTRCEQDGEIYLDQQKVLLLTKEEAETLAPPTTQKTIEIKNVSLGEELWINDADGHPKLTSLDAFLHRKYYCENDPNMKPLTRKQLKQTKIINFQPFWGNMKIITKKSINNFLDSLITVYGKEITVEGFLKRSYRLPDDIEKLDLRAEKEKLSFVNGIPFLDDVEIIPAGKRDYGLAKFKQALLDSKNEQHNTTVTHNGMALIEGYRIDDPGTAFATHKRLRDENVSNPPQDNTAINPAITPIQLPPAKKQKTDLFSQPITPSCSGLTHVNSQESIFALNSLAEQSNISHGIQFYQTGYSSFMFPPSQRVKEENHNAMKEQENHIKCEKN